MWKTASATDAAPALVSAARGERRPAGACLLDAAGRRLGAGRVGAACAGVHGGGGAARVPDRLAPKGVENADKVSRVAFS